MTWLKAESMNIRRVFRGTTASVGLSCDDVSCFVNTNKVNAGEVSIHRPLASKLFVIECVWTVGGGKKSHWVQISKRECEMWMWRMNSIAGWVLLDRRQLDKHSCSVNWYWKFHSLLCSLRAGTFAGISPVCVFRDYWIIHLMVGLLLMLWESTFRVWLTSMLQKCILRVGASCWRDRHYFYLESRKSDTIETKNPPENFFNFLGTKIVGKWGYEVSHATLRIKTRRAGT